MLLQTPARLPHPDLSMPAGTLLSHSQTAISGLPAARPAPQLASLPSASHHQARAAAPASTPRREPRLSAGTQTSPLQADLAALRVRLGAWLPGLASTGAEAARAASPPRGNLLALEGAPPPGQGL